MFQSVCNDSLNSVGQAYINQCFIVIDKRSVINGMLILRHFYMSKLGVLS